MTVSASLLLNLSILFNLLGEGYSVWLPVLPF